MVEVYATFGEALQDPSSAISRFVAEGERVMASNAQVIDRLVASGLSREEAWSEALRGIRARRVA